MIFTLLRRMRKVKRKNNFDFVTYMRTHDIQLWDTNEEFMQAYAHRKSTFEAIHLRFGTENDFVEDLVRENLLTVETAPTLWERLKGKGKQTK